MMIWWRVLITYDHSLGTVGIWIRWKYTEPYRRRIERDILKRLPALDSIFGLKFENLVINNRQKLFELLALDVDDIVYDNPFFQNKTSRQQGCQIDYMIQTRLNVLYIFWHQISQSAHWPGNHDWNKRKNRSLITVQTLFLSPWVHPC